MRLLTYLFSMKFHVIWRSRFQSFRVDPLIIYIRVLKSTKEGSTAVMKVSVEERAKQFKEDLYVDGGILFCKYCQHSVDYVHVDTIKDHLLSKKHLSRKEKDDSCSSTNLTLTSMV